MKNRLHPIGRMALVLGLATSIAVPLTGCAPDGDVPQYTPGDGSGNNYQGVDSIDPGDTFFGDNDPVNNAHKWAQDAIQRQEAQQNP